MTISVDVIRDLPVAELRRLVRIKENHEEIHGLMEQRDRLLEDAKRIQGQIDELIERDSARVRKTRRGPSVKVLCGEALRGSKIGMTAAAVKNAVLERHPHRDNRTFYNQVFIALTRSPEFRKLKNGKFVVTGKKRKGS